MKSLNQLHKESGAKVSFKEWLNRGQEIFNDQKARGYLPESTTFEWWANEVNKYTHFDGSIGEQITLGVKQATTTPTTPTPTTTEKKIDWTSIFNSAKDIAGSASQVVNAVKTNTGSTGSTSGTSPQPLPKTSATILGMKPGVAIAVGGVLVILVGVGIWAIVRKNK